MNHDTRRAVLADYLDQRVYVTGVFERLATNKNPSKPFKVALLQDAEVELSRARHDLGHVWLQHAETLAEFHPGDRIRCSCRIGKYHKTLPAPDTGGYTVRTDYSLAYPTDVKLLSRPVAVRAPEAEAAPSAPAPLPAAAEGKAEAPAPPEEESAKATDPVQLILELRDLVQRLGGSERLVALQQAVAGVGGWERVQEVHALAEELGGWERLEQLLGLLKL